MLVSGFLTLLLSLQCKLTTTMYTDSKRKYILHTPKKQQKKSEQQLTILHKKSTREREMINYTKKKKSQAVSSLSFFLYSSSTYLTLLHFFFSTSALPRVSTKLKYSVCIIFNLKQHEFVLIIFLINPLRVSYALRS